MSKTEASPDAAAAASAPASSGRSRWFPIALALSLLAVFFPTFDWDIGWHLANGREMLRTGRILNEDVFSFTQLGKPYLNREWLAQLVLYAPFALGGYAGLFAFKLAITAVIVTLCWKTLAALAVPARLAAPLIPLGVVAGLHRYLERPELFSLLGSAALVAILVVSREGQWRRGVLFAIPILLNVWEWLHGAVFGWAILAAAVVGENLAARVPQHALAPSSSWLKTLNIAAAIAIALSLLNPFGLATYGAWRVVIDGSEGLEKIAEFQPATLRMHWLILAMTGAAALALLLRRGTLRLSETLWLFGFSLLTWRYGRVAGVFGIAALPCLGFLAASAPSARRTLPAVLALLLAGALYFEKASPWSFVDRRAEWFADERLAPAGAVRFALAQGVQGPLYNTGNLGGYLALELYPHHRIFQFNHSAVWGDTYTADPSIPSRHGIEWAIVGYEEERAAMFPEPAWAYVVVDDNAVVAIRRNSINQALIEQFETRHFSPALTPADLSAGLHDREVGHRLAFETSVYCAYRRNTVLCPVLMTVMQRARPAPPWFEQWQPLILRRQQNG